jgi:8-oxo-dGTP diphosphatase
LADRLKFHYCPMCRTELETRCVFDRDRQQCPKCDWIHFLDPKVGAGVIIAQDGKLLLARRGVDPGMGLWCLPSGFVEIDESPAAAAIRECKEETNLEVELIGRPDVYHYYHDGRGGGVLLLYQARIIGGSPRAGDDVDQVAFFDVDSLPPPHEIAFLSHQQALTSWKVEQQAQNQRRNWPG